MNISGNTILVTGGSTGIGFAMAKQFVELGNEVIICGRRETRLKEAKEHVPQLHYKVCDLGNEKDRFELYSSVIKEFPSLNILVNNGAYQNDYSLTDGLEALRGAQEEINVILTSPIMMNALFTDHLSKQKNAAIVNVTSMLGFTPIPRIPVYCAAKAGFHTYTLLLRKQFENAGIDIRVFEAPPPRVETELNIEGRKKANYDKTPKGLSPEEYADVVISGMKEDRLDIFMVIDGVDIWAHPRKDYELIRLNTV